MKIDGIKIILALAIAVLLGFVCEIIAPETESRNWISLAIGFLSIASVIIPASVSEIGNCAFADCTALANIYPQTKEPETLTYGTNIFLGVDKETCRIIVPTGTLSKYKSTLPWKEFFHIEQGSGFAPGDVNGDGVVNGSDVTSLYNVLLDNTPVGGDADVNSDGVVSGADVTALYNILLSGN